MSRDAPGGNDRPKEAWLVSARAIKHEMSNILMGAQGQVELLQRHPELSDKSTEKLRVIREQLRRMQEQLEALSDISR